MKNIFSNVLILISALTAANGAFARLAHADAFDRVSNDMQEAKIGISKKFAIPHEIATTIEWNNERGEKTGAISTLVYFQDGKPVKQADLSSDKIACYIDLKSPRTTSLPAGPLKKMFARKYFYTGRPLYGELELYLDDPSLNQVRCQSTAAGVLTWEGIQNALRGYLTVSVPTHSMTAYRTANIDDSPIDLTKLAPGPFTDFLRQGAVFHNRLNAQ